MHLEHIRFDSVFDVQARAGLFSFRSRGHPHYGIVLPGRVVPDEGATYAVVMVEAGNLHGVLGWRDLGSGRVALHESVPGVMANLLMEALYYTMPLLALGLWLGGAWGALAAMLLGAGVLAYRGWHALRRIRAVRRALAPA